MANLRSSAPQHLRFDPVNPGDDPLDPQYRRGSRRQKIVEAPLPPAPSIAPDPLASGTTSVDPGFVDPLSRAHAEVEASKLVGGQHTSLQLSAAAEEVKQREQRKDARVTGEFVPWSAKRERILAEFTTNTHLRVPVAFSDDQKEPVSVVHDDTVKSRLDQLEKKDEIQETMELSQQDYVKHAQRLHGELHQAWSNDDRVAALRMAIQCAKLLGDTSVPPFYPSQFVLVSEILDTFGDLVFERIFKNADLNDASFISTDVALPWKETARNWLYKIASIRELLPRVMIEMALLPIYRFISPISDFPLTLSRLRSQIRGIGDPLVAAYARVYLLHRGHVIAPNCDRKYIFQAMADQLFTFKQLPSSSYQAQLKEKELTLPAYFHLFEPAMEWVYQCLAHQAPEEVLTSSLKVYHEYCTDGVVLNSIIVSFDPIIVSRRALEFVNLIKQVDGEEMKIRMFKSLGVCLALAPPPPDERLTILNEVWKYVSKLTDVDEYMRIVDVYVEFPLKFLSHKETNTLLGDIIRHVKPDRQFEKYQDALQSIVSKVLTHTHDFSILLAMTKFLPMIDLLQGNEKVEASKMALESFVRYGESTNDPVVVSALLDMGAAAHDSLNPLSRSDEVQVVGILIQHFIGRVNHGRDYEARLEFLVQCRHVFGSLDAVLERIVLNALELAMAVCRTVKSRHTRKTSNFIHACLAFAYVTIPSIDSFMTRLWLSLASAQVSLINQSLAQSDAFLKSAVTQLPDLPSVIEVDGQVRSTDPMLAEYVTAMAGTLVVVPGHPDGGPLYVMQGLVKVLCDRAWEKGTDASSRSWAAVVGALSALQLDVLPYHIAHVDSNDTLYGNANEYLEEVRELAAVALDAAVAALDTIEREGDATSRRARAMGALHLLGTLISLAEPDQKLVNISVSLWKIAVGSMGDGVGGTTVGARHLRAIKEGVKLKEERDVRWGELLKVM